MQSYKPGDTIRAMSQQSSLGRQLQEKAARVQQGSARAAVLGINDGLVSTVCLVIGVAATGAPAHFVVTAGVAGLLAGAFSMAAGEWISVKAQVELLQGLLGQYHKAWKADREGLIHSLAHRLMKYDLTKEEAHVLSRHVAKSKQKFTHMYTAQVIGINQDELGSPWKAAGSSFVFFAVGALIPLAPWLFVSGHPGIVASAAVTSVAGLVVGGVIAWLSQNSVLFGAMRQLLIIAGASLVTYGIGYAFGVTTS